MLWWTTQNLVITTFLAGTVWCLCRVLRVGPVWRHALWMVVLLKLLTPPLLFWPWAVRDPLGLSDGSASIIAKVGPPAGATSPSARARVPVGGVAADLGASPDAESDPDPDLEVDDSPAVVVTPPRPCVISTSTGSASVPVEPIIRRRVQQVLPWLGGAWIAGGVAIALLQGVRIVRMLNLLRRGRPADAALLRHVETSARRLGVRPVAVRVVAGIGSPVIWALRRPLLLWPEEMPAGVSDQAICGLIVHELAHVKRRDHWVGWLELLAGCVWWWDPLFWYVRHQLRENAELACDAWVVSAPAGSGGGREGRRAYAEALLAVCECASNRLNRMNRMAPMPAVGVSTGGRRFLERRLAMILRDRVTLRLPRLGFLSVGLMALCTLPAWSQKAAEDPVPIDVRAAAIAADGSVHLEGTSGVSAISPDGTVTTRFYNVADNLPKAAQEVLDQLAGRREEARQEARRKIEQARVDTIEQLKQLQDRYTKAGQLDEAVAVRDAVRRLEAEGGAARVTRTRALGIRPTIRASADPGNLTAYRDKVGQSFYFDVTGSTEGTVWGNVIYTDDSALAAAAVHAGVLSPGQRGFVKVTILPGRDSYAGSDSNGVKSLPYEEWPGSYSVEANNLHNSGVLRLRNGVSGMPGGEGLYPGGPSVPPPAAPGMPGGSGLYPGGPSVPPPAAPAIPGGGGPGYPGGPSSPPPGSPGLSPGLPVPGGSGGPPPRSPGDLSGSDLGPAGRLDPASGASDLQQLRDRVGQSIETDLVGSTQGQVWGTGVYTDDSSPAAAAVHAGVLRDGESGHVRITILPGQDSYQGSDHNGVSSQPWKTWQGSFRIERANKPPEELRSSGDTPR